MFIVSVEDQRVAIPPGQAGQAPFNQLVRLASHYGVLRPGRLNRLGALSGIFATTPALPSPGADLVVGDTDGKGRGIARRIELIRTDEELEQRLLSRVIGIDLG